MATSNRFEQVNTALASWKNGTPAGQLTTENWSSHEWLHFVRHLPSNLTTEQMPALDNAFGFSQSGNSEIQAAWFAHVITHQYTAAYPQLKAFLTKVGRRKFLVPLYKQMAETPEGKKMALDIYRQARPNYHAVSTNTLDKLLSYND
jgi:hypothetical protein